LKDNQQLNYYLESNAQFNGIPTIAEVLTEKTCM